MSDDFGHLYASGPGIHIDSWGAGPFVIHVDGKSFRFEDSDRFGPLLLRKDGEPKANSAPVRSPFWRAYQAWRDQGRSMAEDGVTCVWVEPKPTVIRKLDSKNAVLVEGGDPGGKVVEA